MNLTCSAKTVKYLLFIFNLIFVITGIIILAVGVSVKTYYYSYDTFLDEKYFSLPNLLIATGAIIFFISFFGCCGAIRESWLMVAIFTGLLIVIFIFEFSAGIAGYVLRDKTASYLEDKLTDSMKQYLTNPEVTNMWDVIQKEFECCGVQNYTDWKPIMQNDSLPITCCPSKSGIVNAFYCNADINVPIIVLSIPPVTVAVTTTVAAGVTTTVLPTTAGKPTTSASMAQRLIGEIPAPYPHTSTLPYSTGCKEGFGNFVRRHAVDLGGVGIALAVIQLIGIFFSCYLARQLKHGYYST